MTETAERLPDVMNFHGGRAITVEDMVERNKLITIDQGRELLTTTEPLSYRPFESGPGMRFEVDASAWNATSLDSLHGTELVPVALSLSVGGLESQQWSTHQLTKDALTEAASHCKVSKSFMDVVPGDLFEDTLNRFYRGGVIDKSLQLMTIGEDQHGAALARETLVPFSNLALLDRAVAAITERYGEGMAVYLDRTKLSHSMKGSLLQLVVPEIMRQIENTGEEYDNWWGGIQIANSLAGESQTAIEGFMFRVLCTNGMIDRSGTAGSWSRRGSGGNAAEDAYAWAQQQVDEVLGGMEHTFDRVQALTEESLEGEVAMAARDVFDTYRIPRHAREAVMEQLVESDQLTMYAVTNAVTAAANSADSPSAQQLLMRAGGDVAEHSERCASCHRLNP